MILKVNPKGFTKTLVIPDVHKPFHNPRSWNAVMQYARMNGPWDYVIYLGDLFDLACISRHDKTFLKNLENKRVIKDIRAGEDCLRETAELLASDGRQVLIEGNHEYRLVTLVKAMPSLESLVEIPNVLDLEKYRCSWVPFWSTGETVTLGKSAFIHGHTTGQDHAKTTVRAYGTNVFYGHTHDVMSYPQVWVGEDSTIVGQSLGCLCKPQGFMRGRPNKWQQAFGIFYHRPDGFFTYYVPMIFSGKFVGPDGKEYYGTDKERRIVLRG